MSRKSNRSIIALCVWLPATLLSAAGWSATFGTPVPLGGHAADLALDERRGVLYVANFTANRVDVVSLADHTVQNSMNVSPQPGSLALSPDGRYLVVTHFGNFKEPSSESHALTVIDLETRGRQTYALGAPGLGVAFGANGLALVVTTADFSLFDPVTGKLSLLTTVPELKATSLPAPPPNMPPNILQTSLNVSGNGARIYGLTDQFEFGFDAGSGRLRVLGYTSSPPQGPMAVSVNHDGSKYLAGWVLHGSAIWDGATGVWNLAQFPDAEGLLHVGSHAIDDWRGLVYAQVSQKDLDEPDGSADAGVPVLQVLRADNLAVLDRIRLPESLAGKSVLSADRSTMYSLSESGIMVLPVGLLAQAPQVRSSDEHLLFRSDPCSRTVMKREITIHDPSGHGTDFSVQADTPGVEVTPSSGVTPAQVTIRVDPAAFRNITGTAGVQIRVSSAGAVNLPRPIRVLVSTPGPDQRGAVIPMPGHLVDVLPDPYRDRFFVLRQDTNEVLVFDGSRHELIASLATGNTPTQMAITFDRRWLLVGHDNSQYLSVFDLETLQPAPPIRTPPGHYPRSVAASGNAILTANRVSGPAHTIDRVDLTGRTVTELPSLGVYENTIDERTVLAASPNGSSILVVEANGNVMLYNATADTFTISRQEAEELEGAYAASSFGQFVAGSRLMNPSLVTTSIMETGTGRSSGFAFVDGTAFRTTAPAAAAAGVIQRVDLATGGGILATRMAEAPRLGTENFPFTRTVAPLYSRQAIIALTTSGFTVLPWDYDSWVAPPKINKVVNAADYTEPVAPGGLIAVFGESLSPVNKASGQLPLPTALGDSCLTVNGVPSPILFVSPQQINAQLPFHADGQVALVLYTPGGMSDSYNLTIRPNAPSIFQASVPGGTRPAPAIIRETNGLLVSLSNPIHREDKIVIYLTGMGRTTPAVEAGVPGPSDPPASPLVPVEVRLAGVGVPTSFVGLAPGEVGVYQIKAQVPWWTPKGMEQPLTITQGDWSTTVAVRVVD